MATDDAALVAELRRWAAQADGPHGASHENIYSCPKCHGGHAGPELARVEWRRLLDLAEEAIRLRGVRDAAMAAAKDLTGGELFIDDKNGIGLIAACAALAPDDAQLRAALDAAKEKP